MIEDRIKPLIGDDFVAHVTRAVLDREVSLQSLTDFRVMMDALANANLKQLAISVDILIARLLARQGDKARARQVLLSVFSAGTEMGDRVAVYAYLLLSDVSESVEDKVAPLQAMLAQKLQPHVALEKLCRVYVSFDYNDLAVEAAMKFRALGAFKITKQQFSEIFGNDECLCLTTLHEDQSFIRTAFDPELSKAVRVCDHFALPTPQEAGPLMRPQAPQSVPIPPLLSGLPPLLEIAEDGSKGPVLSLSLSRLPGGFNLFNVNAYYLPVSNATLGRFNETDDGRTQLTVSREPGQLQFTIECETKTKLQGRQMLVVQVKNERPPEREPANEQQQQEAPAAAAAQQARPPCTFVETGRTFQHQEWFKCMTCWPSEDAGEGICVPCSQRCHVGHKLVQQESARMYCGKEEMATFFSFSFTSIFVFFQTVVLALNRLIALRLISLQHLLRQLMRQLTTFSSISVCSGSFLASNTMREKLTLL